MSNEKFKVKFGLAVGDTAATIDGTSGDIVTNGNLTLNADAASVDSVITANSGADSSTLKWGPGGGSNKQWIFNDNVYIQQTTATTNDSVVPLALDGRCTSAPAIGFSTNLDYVITNTAINDSVFVGRLGLNLTDNTLGAEYAVMDFEVVENGAVSTKAELEWNGDFTAFNDLQAKGDILANEDQTNVDSGLYAYKGAAVGSLLWNGTEWTATGGINSGGGTFGNVTVGVATDQTISTTSGDLVLDSATDIVSVDAALQVGVAPTNASITMSADTTGIATTGITSTASDFTITHGGGTLVNVNSYILLSGVTPAGYNGIWRVNAASAGSLTIQSNANLGTASVQGTIYYGSSSLFGTTTNRVSLGTTSPSINLGSGSTFGQPSVINLYGNAFTSGTSYIAGQVRDTTTLLAGDTWSFLSGAATAVRGLSIDNSFSSTKRPAVVMRGLSNARPMVIGELNRGTTASPLAVANNGTMLEIAASGHNGTQYVTDATTVSPISLSFTAAEAFTSPAGVNTANGSRLRVDAQPVGVTATALSRSNIINHTATTATYRSDAWTFSTREVAAGGTNTTQMTLDSSGNAVHTGDVAVNGGDLTTTQTTATLFNTNATTLNVGQAATTVSLGATTGTATIRNATTALTGVLRVNGNDIQSSTGAVVMSMSTNDATFADVVQVNGILNVRSGLTYNMLSTTGGASENTLTILKQDAAASADHAVINFATYRSTAGTYSPTQNGDKLGEFKFNGQYASGASPTSGVPAQILSNATENWTATANGQAIQFWGTKAGTTTGVNVINANPETMFLRSDLLTINDSANVNLVGGKIVYGRQYIEAYSTQDQTNPVANAENLMSFNNTGISNGISIVTNGTTLTRITMANAGLYNIQFSAQLSQTSGGNHNAFIWLKKNGTTVANTAGDVKVAGNGDRIMASWNYIVSAAASDYYELAWAATDTSVVLDYVAASAPIPAIPSVILTVVPIGA